MTSRHTALVAEELHLRPESVAAAAELFAEGCTIPFVARYRKEATGSLDEVALLAIRDRLAQLEELDKRREAILKSLEERELLTEELRRNLEEAPTLARLEDLYLPFRPKRRTRATIAKEKGLEPLAALLWQQCGTDPAAAAKEYVDPEKGVENADDALDGACDIMAEWVSEDGTARASLRQLFAAKAMLSSKVKKGKEEEGAKFRDYFAWNEPTAKAPSHRVLALFRGEREGFLSLSLLPPEEEALTLLERLFVKTTGPDGAEVRAAVADGYTRLLAPSMETELRNALKRNADAEAVTVFARNVREVLLAPPLGRKVVLAVDPGLRTGCKLVVLSPEGKLLETAVMYPHTGKESAKEALRLVRDLAARHNVEAVAVGNGTAGRETEAFLRAAELPGNPLVVMVNESGASIYSASDVAREEFPDQDVTVRGAVSIGRRLQDPLAELVKIDPKSIGVGQYQHDVDQKLLRQALDDVVTSCVNSVGVDLNTASKELLSYVSGLGPQLAANIVTFRNEHGPFRSRKELRKVPRLGPKAFEQAAGFLRIRDGENPLDASAVHPDSYDIVEEMARDLACDVADLLAEETLRRRIDPARYIRKGVGLPTLADILAELAKPGRDPRKSFEVVRFAPGVTTLEDLVPGMILQGVVSNVTAFGAFVDVGVHQDGLVHVSRMADRFVANPSELVSPGQRVRVAVEGVDLQRRRISLTMKGIPQHEPEDASGESA
jgi:uncharacterized protein